MRTRYGSGARPLSALAIIGMVLPVVMRVRRLGIAAAALGVMAMLATPAAWAASTLDASDSGTATDAIAGPGEESARAAANGPVNAEIQRAVSNFLNRSATLTPVEQENLAYVDAHRSPDSTYAFATDAWLIAQPYVDADAAPVLPMGGFSGQVPLPTIAQEQNLVRTGRLSFFLLNPPGAISMSILFGSAAGQSVEAIDAWVRASCTLVQLPGVSKGAAAGGVLYACGPQSVR